MLIAFEIAYGLVIWCTPIFLIFRMFFRTSRSLLLTVWVAGSIFYLFFLGFGVGLGLTYIFNGSGWEHTITPAPSVMNWWLNGNWIGDGGYHDIPMWAVLLTPYVFIVHWLSCWFHIVFFNGHLILSIITAITFSLFLNFSIPFLKTINR